MSYHPTTLEGIEQAAAAYGTTPSGKLMMQREAAAAREAIERGLYITWRPSLDDADAHRCKFLLFWLSFQDTAFRDAQGVGFLNPCSHSPSSPVQLLRTSGLRERMSMWARPLRARRPPKSQLQQGLRQVAL